jgi:hypothetical protein
VSRNRNDLTSNASTTASFFFITIVAIIAPCDEPFTSDIRTFEAGRGSSHAQLRLRLEKRLPSLVDTCPLLRSEDIPAFSMKKNDTDEEGVGRIQAGIVVSVEQFLHGITSCVPAVLTLNLLLHFRSSPLVRWFMQ